jgi:hypothetical protein
VTFTGQGDEVFELTDQYFAVHAPLPCNSAGTH